LEIGPHAGVVALGVPVLALGRARRLSQVGRLHGAGAEQQQEGVEVAHSQ